MHGPTGAPSLEDDEVVGENRESAGEQRGAERGFSVPAVAQERDRLAVDDDNRAVQRLNAERDEREGEDLAEQVDAERFPGGVLQPTVANLTPVR